MKDKGFDPKMTSPAYIRNKISFIKLLKFGFVFTQLELIVLLVGMITAFLVSIFVIKFLMEYIKKHDFPWSSLFILLIIRFY